MGSTYERGIYPREGIGQQRHGISMILRIINMRGSRLGAKELTSSLTEIPCLRFRSAESMKDFIHKLQIILKELSESYICLKIIWRAKLYQNDKLLNPALAECDELILIFVKSIQTSKKKFSK